MVSFSLDELTLPYGKWKALSEERLPQLDPAARRWLYAWNAWDLAANARNDDERRIERRGHYLGWFDAQDDDARPVSER